MEAARAIEYQVFYDDQCEICQAGVSWLRALDRRGRVQAVALSSATLPGGLAMEDCLRELHVITPRRIVSGWDAVATLARLFPATWLIGVLGAAPPLSWLGRVLYRYVARNRYAVSRCRGGVCGSAKPAQVRKRATMGAFWSCRTAGLAMRIPLVAAAWAAGVARNVVAYGRLFRRRVTLLDGKLELLFLGSATADLVPLIFGERFVAIVYDGVVIDPGSSKMRRSLRRHLAKRPARIQAITATHHHEEHSGNLEWLASRANARLYLAPKIVEKLRNLRVPPMRRFVIGQPPPVTGPVSELGDALPAATGELQVVETPGHSDDHVSFYDPREKILFAGDSFMGSYFSTPNPDVDSLAWIRTLERALELGVEILVEGHGHVHTLRPDVPDIPDVVVRQDPAAALRAKLTFFRWVREQIEAGQREGMPPRAIAATCFPWGRRWAWERFGADLTARLLSGGEFSRSELVRSFHRSETGGTLPEVYEVRRTE